MWLREAPASPMKSSEGIIVRGSRVTWIQALMSVGFSFVSNTITAPENIIIILSYGVVQRLFFQAKVNAEDPILPHQRERVSAPRHPQCSSVFLFFGVPCFFRARCSGYKHISLISPSRLSLIIYLSNLPWSSNLPIPRATRLVACRLQLSALFPSRSWRG